MRRILIGLLVLGSATLNGCGLVIGQLVRSQTQNLQAEQQVNASLARYRQLVMASDVDRAADMFSVDGVLTQDGEPPLKGQENIRLFLKKASGIKLQAYQLQSATTSISERSAKQHGSYAQTTLAPTGTSVSVSGEFDAQWTQQADGRWLLDSLHTNTASTPG
jgi:uncharacterized protein (TIGR02246 family)